ncbi:CRISPR-associated protein Cas4 [Solidesulfovibrio carbinoliphilus subsp. oakridgensis]|uniref:CRISPR-associated exonuclease Cas4 n=1 Tax=Solidesulfovibrio carbinoliphilus subsp. oakridgensis TaxID=694327 RepID=G7Q6F4_9BACT|nr:CRISPR-associated protein Cas4 [Solidesulfovibrio carbinoliphilus]EHJ47327.1 CRISPR-associated protein Cas4 [Solidesulfovibrio carbinoliphilus subsp. oakridgensis]
MFTEDELLPISALQHLLFCRRQCALIHIERAWAENVFTVQGGILHERAHEQGYESHDGVRIARAVPLRSLELGLTGVADVVEFHPAAGGGEIAFPVEYKRGKPKPDVCDTVQLCAQALCLEEMLGRPVPAGALFYGRTRRRLAVAIDAALRQTTRDACLDLHAFLRAGRTPEAVHDSRCASCSMEGACLPRACTGKRSVRAYLQHALETP